MNRQLVPAKTPWASELAYSRAVRAGCFVAVSQTSASDENGMIHGGSDAYAQAVHALDRVELALQAVGGELTDTIRVRISMANHADWERVAKAFSERFREIQPAVSLYETPMVSSDILVEFEVDAVIER
ncbi:MAG: Rid family hydrolase [Pirellulaceae bacterium]